jgi:Prenyltransferase and squalene oxidase repeat
MVRRAIKGLIAGHMWLPSWGTSVLVHGVALLILALLFLRSSSNRDRTDLIGSLGPQELQGEAIDTLISADRAGDPFTKADSSEFPSISFEAPRKPIATIAQPAAPPSTEFAATITPPKIGALGTLRLNDRVLGLAHVEDMSAPFAGRDPEMKARLIRREGGSVQSEQAVQAGLDWIARHQRADGAWTLDYHAQCTDPPCPDEQLYPSNTAATGLGLLPLLGAGHIHTKKSRYQDNIQRGLDYLILVQNAEGELFLDGGPNYRFYSHAIATMALCEAYGISKDPKLHQPAQRAINWIVKCQNLDDGGWRYQPLMPGDTSVIGWQMFALRSGRLAGLDVPKRTINGCKVYLDLAAADPLKQTYSYVPSRMLASPTMTAEGLLCRQYLGWPSDFPALRRGAKIVYDDLQTNSQRNIYYWYYATQLLHNLGGKEWVDWNKHIRDGLIGMQVGGQGCDRGSWSPRYPQRDRYGDAGGRLYMTSLSILTLEVYYRWLPLYRVTDESDDPKAIKDAHDRAQAKADLPAAQPAPAGKATRKGR